MRNTHYVIATAIAGALTLAGCTTAAATSTAPISTAPTSTAATATSAAAAAPVPTQVTIYSVNTDAPVLSAVVSGPVFGDWGSAAEVEPGSTVPVRHGAEMLLRLAHGTFRIDIKDISAKFTTVLGPANIPSTCSDYVSVSGSVPIVAGSGTGAYKGIAGAFSSTLSVNELHHTPCSATVTTFRQLVWLNGAGKITRP